MLKNINNPSEILDHVRKKGYIIFDNAFETSLFDNISNFWINFFGKNNKNKFKSRDIYGSSRSLGDLNYSSFRNNSELVMYRTTEYPWNVSMHDPTRKLICEMNKVRNLALGLDIHHGSLYEPHSQVSFNQINCYPAGRGKMFAHKDTPHDKLLLSCMFNVTIKKTHFEEGGLYLMINGEKIYVDDYMKPCSVIFYNGNLIHGVDKILSNSDIGRIAGYPMKQFFLSNNKLPTYLKTLIRIDNGIKRKLKLKSHSKQGNSALEE